MAVKKVATVVRFENETFAGAIEGNDIVIRSKPTASMAVRMDYHCIPDLIELLTAMHGEAADMEGEK